MNGHGSHRPTGAGIADAATMVGRSRPAPQLRQNCTQTLTALDEMCGRTVSPPVNPDLASFDPMSRLFQGEVNGTTGAPDVRLQIAVRDLARNSHDARIAGGAAASHELFGLELAVGRDVDRQIGNAPLSGEMIVPNLQHCVGGDAGTQG